LADHGHTETLALRVQFDSAAQQKDASQLGMWIFLITEIMFFGGMFACYTVYRNWYPEVFAIASSSLNAVLGAINTCVLLLSSFTMVMAVRAGQLGQQKMIVIFLILTLLFGGVFLYVKESRKRETLERYGHGTPDDWLERRVYTPLHKFGIVLMLGIDLALFGPLPGALVWGAQMLWIPFWAAGVINGVGHCLGYRSFACNDASTNIVPWGILIGGEELHNNHHTFATSAKLSNKWYEFDIGWMYIRMMQAVGLAKVKKVAPTPRLAKGKLVADHETLQAVLSNRYEVMARYAKAVKLAYRQELAHLKEVGEREKYKVMRGARKWFDKEEASLNEPQKRQLPQIFANSQKLRTYIELRNELAAIWERSSASREQLLTQLQDWCHRAEQSGIKALQEFASRLRRYA